MSFTQDFDSRFAASFFEVHYWPHAGRILTVNKESHDPKPLVMELHITGTDGVGLADNTGVTAHVLCEAGNPAGTLVMHDRDGSMTSYDFTSRENRIITA